MIVVRPYILNFWVNALELVLHGVADAVVILLFDVDGPLFEAFNLSPLLFKNLLSTIRDRHISLVHNITYVLLGMPYRLYRRVSWVLRYHIGLIVVSDAPSLLLVLTHHVIRVLLLHLQDVLLVVVQGRLRHAVLFHYLGCHLSDRNFFDIVRFWVYYGLWCVTIFLVFRDWTFGLLMLGYLWLLSQAFHRAYIW